MITAELKETVKKIALNKITQAESFLGSGQGSVKFEYVLNMVIDELKRLPLPLSVRLVLVLFQFALKSELKQEIQNVFNEAKDEINRAKTANSLT
ncbi:MAG: hypothetical protein WCG23_09945 [bacterium]